jgi:hypothetical protein
MTAKELQLAKIAELGETLIATGYLRLDKQATVLGLSRSTTWTITRAQHKNTGLSAAVIKRMLAQPQLPALLRVKIAEYIDQKSAGVYGHNPAQMRRFVAHIRSSRPRSAWRPGLPGS